MTGSRYCESCGRKASDDARYCPGCGRPLDGAGPGPAGPAPEAPSGAPSGEQTVAEIRGITVRSLGQLLLCILTVGIAWLFLRLRRATTRYRVTTQRLEIRTGLVNFTRRTIELFRVKDLEIQEPWFQRMQGAGTLVIRSQDAGEPVVALVGVPKVHDLHERLRALVQSERRRIGVRVFEDE